METPGALSSEGTGQGLNFSPAPKVNLSSGRCFAICLKGGLQVSEFRVSKVFLGWEGGGRVGGVWGKALKPIPALPLPQ